MTTTHDSMQGLMSTRAEARALAQRIKADGYEVLGLDSMPLLDDVMRRVPEEFQRRMWHVSIWLGHNGRSFLSEAEYDTWRTQQ